MDKNLETRLGKKQGSVEWKNVAFLPSLRRLFTGTLANSLLRSSNTAPCLQLCSRSQRNTAYLFHSTLSCFFPSGIFNLCSHTFFNIFCCHLFFAGTGQNNKTIFYIPHTTTIILCDNLHFPFFVAPHIAIAQKNERSIRMKKSTVFNLPTYGIAQKNEKKYEDEKIGSISSFSRAQRQLRSTV